MNTKILSQQRHFSTEQAMKVISYLLKQHNLSYIYVDCLFPITSNNYWMVRRLNDCVVLGQVTIYYDKQSWNKWFVDAIFA